jgi:hypothetical protein
MQGMTTVVIVHASAAPNRPVLAALCDEHTALLHRAARIDELVGFSAIADCDACALTSCTGQDSNGISQPGLPPHSNVIPRPA